MIGEIWTLKIKNEFKQKYKDYQEDIMSKWN